MRAVHLALWMTWALWCSACSRAGPVSIKSLRLIDEQRVARALAFEGTTVGGLSSIDYDPGTGTWYVLSDDRSDRQPARFYTARLSYDEKAMQPMRMTGVVTLRQPDGSAYPNAATDARHVADPESIRFDGCGGTLWWTSEGDRGLWVDPFIRQINVDGTHRSELGLPPLFRMLKAEQGPRNNGVFEGLALGEDCQTLYVSLEDPLYQDGPLADTVPTRSPIRIIRFDLSTGQPTRQYAYLLERIAAEPKPPSSAKSNGVVELLVLDANRLLVLERSYSYGVGNTVRVYEVDLSAATDVSGMEALAEATYTPVSKRLVLDFGTLGLPVVDNIEGMTWGPKLPNGHRSIVFVSDDNFSSTQVTQLLAFEVLPD